MRRGERERKREREREREIEREMAQWAREYHGLILDIDGDVPDR